MGNKNMTTVRQ